MLDNLQRLLHERYATGATEPVESPNDAGAFPDAAPFLPTVQPLVIDANWIRSDVLYMCRKGGQTALVTAGNQGFVRLYCARHVVDEVVEHHPEWAAQGSIPPEEFLQVWTDTYLPLLRVVDPPAGLLSAEESTRIEELSIRDGDDVPSATLSLLLGAPYISRDIAAVKAVYGSQAARQQQSELLLLIKSASTAQLLQQMLVVTMMLPVWGITELAKLAIGAARRSPPLAIVGLIVISAGAWAGRRRLGHLRGWAIDAAEALAPSADHLAELVRRVRGATPDQPGWDDVGACCRASDVVTRACMHTMARQPVSLTTPKDLTEKLPFLPVAHGVQQVRGVLGSHAPHTFRQVYRGQWQLGSVAASPLPT